MASHSSLCQESFEDDDLHGSGGAASGGGGCGGAAALLEPEEGTGRDSLEPQQGSDAGHGSEVGWVVRQLEEER